MSSTEPVSQVPSGQKARYRVTNGSEYDRALVARGDITSWFDPEALQASWLAASTGKLGGAPVRYSDGSIQTLLVLKQVFHLPYRAWEGIGRLLMRLMGLWICQLRITRSCGV